MRTIAAFVSTRVVASWQRSGRNVDALEAVMSAEDLVDAALVGFDLRELVTIPPLPDAAQWEAFEAARQAMLPNLAQALPATRYLGGPKPARTGRSQPPS